MARESKIDIDIDGKGVTLDGDYKKILALLKSYIGKGFKILSIAEDTEQSKEIPNFAKKNKIPYIMGDKKDNLKEAFMATVRSSVDEDETNDKMYVSINFHEDGKAKKVDINKILKDYPNVGIYKNGFKTGKTDGINFLWVNLYFYDIDDIKDIADIITNDYNYSVYDFRINPKKNTYEYKDLDEYLDELRLARFDGLDEAERTKIDNTSVILVTSLDEKKNEI